MKYLFIFLIALNISAESADKILEKTKNITEYINMHSVSTMTIEKNNEITSSMTSDNYFKKEDGKDYQLIKYTEPARLKGTSILVEGDNIWYYNKRSNRTRLLSSSAKEGSMMGSSFSYDDMTLDYLEDFDNEMIKKERKNYIIKLEPNENKKFSYLLVYIDTKSFLENKLEYYNENEIKYKILNFEKYTKIGNKWYPLELEMLDIFDGKSTRIKTNKNSIDISSNIPLKVFSQRELKK